MTTRAVRSGWQGLVLLLPEKSLQLLLIRLDAQPAVLLAGVSLAVVLADARAAQLLAPASLAVVLADA